MLACALERGADPVRTRGSVGQARQPFFGLAFVIVGFVSPVTIGISIAVAPAVALAMGGRLSCWFPSSRAPRY